MRISLGTDLERFVRDQVKRGQYPSSEDLIRGAVEVLRDQEQWISQNAGRLKKAIGIGIAQLDKGEGEPWDPGAIKAEGRRALAARSRRSLRGDPKPKKS
jgi:putative addiction module CopG family antidote